MESSSPTPIIDSQRQEQAREYAHISRRLMLLDLALGGAYILVWLAAGWPVRLREWINTYTNSPWLVILALGAGFALPALILDLPLSYYEGFSLPHRFGQSTQTLRGWLLDELKSLLLSAVLGGLLLEIIYALLRAAPQTWWLWAAAFMLVFSVILSSLAPVLLFPIFYKFKPLGEEHAELVQRLLDLAVRAGAPVKGVFQFDMSSRTKSANAALTGLGGTRRIILGDTLLAEFSIDEIETVMAHELGHHAHRDIPVGIAVQSVLTLAGLYLASLGLNWGAYILGMQGPADPASLPLFLLALGLFELVTTPLTNAYSRWRETRADQFSLEITAKPQAFASAMTRLANQNLSELNPEPWVEFLLYSHPSLGKRIAMADSFSSSKQ